MTGPVLHLVRHGRSTWNAAGLLQGRTPHVPLDALGQAQAASVAARLAGEPVVQVRSSDQRRALDTAVPIAAAHGLAVVTDPGLREQGHGAWEGTPAAAHPSLRDMAPDRAPPGGESAVALYRRAARVVAALPTVEGHLVLVTHGETLRALLAVLAGRGPERMPRDVTANGAVLSLRRAGARWYPVAAARG